MTILFLVIVAIFGLPIIELVIIALMSFQAFTAASATCPRGAIFCLGLHPIFGIAAAIAFVSLYVLAYTNKVATWIIGAILTVLWFFVGLSITNNGRKTSEMLERMVQPEFWTRFESLPGDPSWSAALLVTIISIGWRYFLFDYLKNSNPVGVFSQVFSIKFARQLPKRLAIFIVLCAIIFVILKACASGGLGR